MERWLFVAVKVNAEGDGESIPALDDALMGLDDVLDFRVRRSLEELQRSITPPGYPAPRPDAGEE